MIITTEKSIRCTLAAEGNSPTEFWEPLSMNALMEYSRQRDAVGKGGYSQGSMKYWNSTPLPAIQTQ